MNENGFVYKVFGIHSTAWGGGEDMAFQKPAYPAIKIATQTTNTRTRKKRSSIVQVPLYLLALDRLLNHHTFSTLMDIIIRQTEFGPKLIQSLYSLLQGRQL